jgi:hypothetical protein
MTDQMYDQISIYAKDPIDIDWSKYEVPMLRTSERKDFKRCPMRWNWNYVEGLQSRGRTANALWFGTGMHLALEHWYVKGKTRGSYNEMLQVWDEYCDGEVRRVGTLSDPDSETKMIDARELGHAMLRDYVIEYGKDTEWEVIATEQPFQIGIPWPEEQLARFKTPPPGPMIWYVGKYDTVMRNRLTGELWLWDHKNVKSIDTAYLQMDDQGGSYLAVAEIVLKHQGLIGQDEYLEGIIFNFLRKAMPDDRPQNEQGLYLNKPTKAEQKLYGANYPGSVSKKQPPPRFHREVVTRSTDEKRSQLIRIQREAVVMNAYRAKQLPLIKNPTRDCSWDCSFFDMCLIEDMGGDVEEFKEALFGHRDPYGDHREDMTSQGGVEMVAEIDG